MRVHIRRAFVVMILVYGIVCLRTPNEYRFLDGVDLLIHETGHLVFASSGDVLQALGGSIFQLLLPLAFVVYFWWRWDWFAVAVVLFWVAQNCWNIARYVGDARTQTLPLVGGGLHDWAYLLGALGWLEYDQMLSAAIRAVGVLIFIASIWIGWQDSGTESGTRLRD